MSWASRCIEDLKAGRVTQVRPRGNSMSGRIESGQLVTLDPLPEPAVGDAVLCVVKGRYYVHLVKATRNAGEWCYYQIGNNHGGVNGWIPRKSIFGVVTKVEE